MYFVHLVKKYTEMCNVEENSESKLIYSPGKDISHELCKRCNESFAKVVLRGNDSYCENCFLITATHKFRSTLGKSHLIRPGDRVLIPYDGGPESSALLHLVESGLNQNTHKKLRFVPILFYIEDSLCSEKVPLAVVVEKFQRTNLQYFISSLSQSLQPKEISITHDLNNFKTNEKLDKEFLSLFSHLKTYTSKQDLLQKLRYRLIASAAAMLECQFVFMADICTNLASTLLSNIALGRGAHLPLDVAFMDDRFTDLKILRPIRDFVLTEISYYNSFNNIVPLKSIQNGSSVNSIQKLTEQFLNDLQENFPATVYTIFRTGEKLTTNKNKVDESDICSTCCAPLDTASKDSTALQATMFSKLISCSGPQASPASFVNKFGTNVNIETEIQEVKAEKGLCYGCSLILQDLSDADLPECLKNYDLSKHS